MTISTLNEWLVVDATDPAPVHTQIEAQIKLKIARGLIRPGHRLPPVRVLAGKLDVHANTVARAYSALAKEGVLVARTGSGTFVARTGGHPALQAEREVRLGSIVSRALVEALSLGFPPEEVEAKVVLHLARFRREAARGPRKKAASVRRRPGLVVSGSHDLALDLLASHMRGLAGLEMTASNTGSLGGLIDLARDKAHVAGCHLLDKESGEYNIPFVKRILAGVPSLVVTLVERTQGFLVAKGNPKNLRAPEDLARDDVTFINRQKGSGTRVLLDFLSRRSGVIPQQVGGYDVEVDTHIEVAEAIASGRADVGLGILAAARATGLDFIPLRNERYDLVVPKSSLDRPQVRALRKTLESREYRASVQSLGGYDTSLTGVVLAEIGA